MNLNYNPWKIKFLSLSSLTLSCFVVCGNWYAFKFSHSLKTVQINSVSVQLRRKLALSLINKNSQNLKQSVFGNITLTVNTSNSNTNNIVKIFTQVEH